MEKKICSKCKEEKELCEFNKNKTRKDGLQTFCKICGQKHSKNYYENNNDKMKTQIHEARKKRKEVIIKYVYDYLINHPCIDCGETNPLVLEFDHRDGVDKICNITELVANGNNIDKINEEIKKCDVRCANCHRIRTAYQLNYTILKFLPKRENKSE